jgi:ribonuclease PH
MALTQQRPDGRNPGDLRPLEIHPNYIIYPEGSVLIATGRTKVLCNASLIPGVPRWRQAQATPGGWITAEYAMLPRATHDRSNRETGAPRARSQEIKRLVGRSLRAGFDLSKLGAITAIIDCDVLQADGGTRTASVTGGYLALAIALHKRIDAGDCDPDVFLAPVAAVSVGLVEGQAWLDLNYEEDSAAEVEANVVMNARDEYIEVQATAEGGAFAKDRLDDLLGLARTGIHHLLAAQAEALAKMGWSKA